LESIIVLVVLAVLAVPVLLLVLLLSVSGLKRRVATLEQRLSELQAGGASDPAPARPQAPAAPAAPAAPTTAAAAVPPRRAVFPEPPALPDEVPLARPVASTATADLLDRVDIPAPLRSAQAHAEAPRAPREPGLPERVLASAKRWFSEGNVPVKVGMLVLLAGVASLLKYASDQGWLRLPVELRLAGIAAAALAGLAFGWRQRLARPGFGLALQGGAIGVLLLVVFAAFKRYDLMPAAAAFALSVVLIAGMCVLAVLQDSRTLAVLGTLAGFLAPLWLSTGSGNHVALFSYYAVLNAGIFAIAWWRPWRVLNLLGFAFTFGIGAAWGVLSYKSSQFASTEPFLLLFFAFYLLIPVFYARRGGGEDRRRVIDGSLVFGTPLVAFALQAGLLRGERWPLALCALGVAAIYLVLARVCLRGERTRLLGQAHAVLAVGFATLAVPLALSAQATAGVFALEGAGLVWLGLRQQRGLPQLSGVVLQLLAAVAYVVAWDVPPGGIAVANGNFMSGLLVALSGFAIAGSFRAARRDVLALLAYLWALAWWAGIVSGEIARFVAADARLAVELVVVGATGWLAAEVHRRRPAVALAAAVLGAFALAVPLAVAQSSFGRAPLSGAGGWAWPLFAVLGVRALWCLRGAEAAPRVAGAAQFAWWLLWATVATLCLRWTGLHFALAGGWLLALGAAPWLALLALALFRGPWLAAPLGEAFASWLPLLRATAAAVVAAIWIGSLAAPLSAHPLPWLPVLNPGELTEVAALCLLACWTWRHATALRPQHRVLLLAIAGLLWITVATLRSVHQWGGAAWGPGLLDAGVSQTSLTIVWSVLGVAGWISGSRRRQHGLWLAGALLMGLVLLKLVAIDRQHLGNLLGIGSFIAYGLLCTLVGYFAPAPPRAPVAGDREEVA